MSNQPLKIASGAAFGNSSSSEVAVTNIGASGTVFAGSFTGRTAYYAWDFVVSAYTDKDGQLYIVFVGGDTEMQVKRTDAQNLYIQAGDSYPLGNFRYDPASGNFCIKDLSNGWFEGVLMGTYATVI